MKFLRLYIICSVTLSDVATIRIHDQMKTFYYDNPDINRRVAYSGKTADPAWTIIKIALQIRSLHFGDDAHRLLARASNVDRSLFHQQILLRRSVADAMDRLRDSLRAGRPMQDIPVIKMRPLMVANLLGATERCYRIDILHINHGGVGAISAPYTLQRLRALQFHSGSAPRLTESIGVPVR